MIEALIMMNNSTEKNTPLMQQYFDIKAHYQETLLFFQVGDFYELFFDDAKQAAAHLAITLTKRGKNKGEDIPLCGIPVHALNHYLTKLIKGGFRVALCEQLSKPQPGTVVERRVTRVFTPATLTDSAMLDEKNASYLLSFIPGQTTYGLLFGELLTAQLFATTIPADSPRMIETELIRFFPDEIVLPDTKHAFSFISYFKKLGYNTSIINSPTTDIAGPDLANDWAQKQFCTRTTQLLEQHSIVKQNLNVLHSYLQKHNQTALTQFKSINFYESDDYVILDPATQKNLELVKNAQDGGRKNTLFAVLDHAKTPMGSRTIQKWILRPLVQKSAIVQRHEVVTTLCSDIGTMQQLAELLGGIADLERIIGRIALGRAQLYDYRALKDSLTILPNITSILARHNQVTLIKALQEKISDFSSLHALLSCSINDDIASEHIIKHGFDHDLDRLRNLLSNGRHEILKLEQAEIARTGITSLKISYNNISGYYIEITNTHLDKIPSDYQHQQTLANRKRFVTKQLQDLERDLYKAHHELNTVETLVFERVKTEVETYLPQLRHLTQSLACLDALFGFATAAYEYRYCPPTFNNQRNIIINQGRHPIVEQTLDTSRFTPNDTTLTDANSTWLITGPNMGGKSTYLRQNALICIMAQCGSFVPAQSADLPIIDRIFTRIGSGDNLAEGKSTFLVEMEEAATICTHATANSLVILDEVGRGTSTYDGMALAQAIIEHIHQTIKARCLFATHYHELTHMTTMFSGIANCHTACKKVNHVLIFTHKIMPGPAAGSFGLDVAKLANIPLAIIQRASKLLSEFQKMNISSEHQGSLFSPTHPTLIIYEQQIEQLKSQLKQHQQILGDLQKLDCVNLTPKQAFDYLWSLVEKARENNQ